MSKNLDVNECEIGGVRPRCSNIELYRIIVMISIICHHYVVNSGLIEVLLEDPSFSHSIPYILFGMWGKTGINCFVMITGWYMCKSNISIRKFLKLLFQIEFYNILISSILYFTHVVDYNFKDYIKDMLPIKNLYTDFASCFLVFYLFIPFLNILIRNMNRIQHSILLLLCISTYTLCPFLHFEVGMNYVGWFVIIYIISSYLRIYSGRFQDNSRFWLICSLASVFGAVLSVLFFSQTERPYRFVSDSNQIFALLVAVSTFMCFRCLPIRYSKIINSIGAATFGVLLIHANNGAMRQWLWRNMVDCVGHYSANVYITYSIFVVLLIFLICVIIDLIRSYFIEKPFFSLLDKHYNMVIKYDNIFK